MNKFEISILGKKSLEKIKPLISNYRYNEYRNYKIFNKDLREQILFNQIAEVVINKRGRCVVACAKDEILGLITLIHLPWDTKHFGFRMAKIGHLICDGNLADSVSHALIRSTLELCRKERVRHLSFRVDTQDFAAIHALQKSGFYVVETLLTYIFTQTNKILQLKDIYKVRAFREKDLPHLVDIAQKSFTQNRFHIDPYVPKNRADSLYCEWIRNACVDKDTAFTFVAEKKNIPVGFFTCELNQGLLKWTKIKVLGRGLAAVLPEAKGAYISFIKAALHRGMKILKVDIGEFDTQIYNYSVIKAYQRFGMIPAKARYTFHKWIN